MWEHFDGKVFFITGASGFVGTATVYRIITQTCPGHVFVLCQGGFPRLQAQWETWLTPEIASQMLNSKKLTVLDGDVLLPNMGISPYRTVKTLQQQVNIAIHAASSINLGSRLRKVAGNIVTGSVNAVNFALECPQLERMVYVSTAYANAHLACENAVSGPDASDTVVRECLYPLSLSEEDLRDEWMAI